MNSPSKTSYTWVSWVQRMPFFYLLLGLFLLYFSVNFVFGIIYYKIHTLDTLSTKVTFLDSIYFSFATALSIENGGFHPLTPLGKVLIIVQSSLVALYFAVMVAALSANMFFPKDTIHFSTKFLYNPQTDSFGIRIINSHNERLVNPEIRISIAKHRIGNVIAPHITVAMFDNIPYLGRHDLTLFFHNEYKRNTDDTDNADDYLNIYHETQKALHNNIDNKNCKAVESRFRIVISVSGNYGIQQIVSYKKYYANELKEGTGFKPIQYNDEDQKKWGNIRYTKFPNF